ncbi:ABC transporter substrate-binding protein [Paenibacillus sp. NPDC056579]|uniref:ABC transporter substrate-binding protein n=1 Tax=unclassified Paenibacillus TaxID=185978 RepID=UPI001EF79BF7|nr:extracellular solute-binding protein [Paenibacillus sp. H1-7]ULL18496.1 extracellular solute-binding protein [Paenibacillus sp. H1-7]
MNTRKHTYWKTAGLAVCVMVTLLSGCSSKTDSAGQADAGEKPAEQKPVTIRVGIKSQGYLTEDEFKRYITEPVKKKYPWITVEMSIYNAKGSKLSELVAAGNVPDIVITNNVNGMPEFLDLDLVTPLDELIQKHRLDLSRLEPQAVEAVKAATQRQDITALPYARNFHALYYNKDIFDKFAVPYPKDGMTWDQVTELAKKLTRDDNGTAYRGLMPNVPERLAAQLSAPFVNPATNKAGIETPEWKRVLDMTTAIHSIPGNSPILFNKEASDLFYKERTLAMLADINLLGDLSAFQDFHWDMVSFPVWPELPGTSPGIDAHLMVLSKTSSNKDDAFRVISAVLSDEVQMDMSRQGRYSVLKDSKIKDAFGLDLTWMAGKNLKAVNMTPAKPYAQTVYDKEGITAVRNALKASVKDGKDTNTALREAAEAFNKKIDEINAGK